MLSPSASAAVRLPAASESEVSAGVFTNRELPEPQWERPIACRADEGPIKPIEWLWPQRIPLGKVTLLTGPAGVGKSLVALDLASRVSRGADFPCTEGDCSPVGQSFSGSFNRGSVLVVAPLHEADDVVRLRLRDMRADMSKVHILSGVFDNTDDRLLALPDDLRELEHMLEKMDFPRLVVIDSLENLCPDKRREANTLRVLEVLARKFKVGLIVVASSNPRKNKLGRYMAPTDKAQRQTPIVWSLIPDDYDEGRAHFIATRCNYGPRARGFTYQIGHKGRIEWGDLDEHQILPELPAVENWLTDVLTGKSVGTLELLKLGAPLGITEGMIHAGCQKLGYQKVKLGFQGGWYWKKPEPPKPPGEIDPAALEATAWLDQPVQSRIPRYKLPTGQAPGQETDRQAEPDLNGVVGSEVALGTEPVEAAVAPEGEPGEGAVVEPAQSEVPSAVDQDVTGSGPAEDDVRAPRDSLAPLEKPQENEEVRQIEEDDSEPRMTPMDADEGRTEGLDH